jgi:hypothetical protein
MFGAVLIMLALELVRFGLEFPGEEPKPREIPMTMSIMPPVLSRYCYMLSSVEFVQV